MRRNWWNKLKLADIKLFKNYVDTLAMEVAFTEVDFEFLKPRLKKARSCRDGHERISDNNQKKNPKGN